jgi:energy-coupling factor transporter ATP-binding protein EcfA2
VRINTVKLSWFRGAAEEVILDPSSKSIIVYGENGAGKSTFVDAVEYLISAGKIGHLAHEQSGKRQERAVPNTQCPADKVSNFRIEFQDKSAIAIQIARDGSAKKTGTSSSGIENWDYRRTVLRQDEVAEFIKSTKGEKYSALLPLLGLGHLETIAENLRKLGKAIETEANVAGLKGSLEQVSKRRKTIFGEKEDDAIKASVRELHKKHCSLQNNSSDIILICKEAISAITTKIARSSADQRTHMILGDIAQVEIEQHVSAIRTASDKLAKSSEPLIAEKLQVLETASAYSKKIKEGEEIDCPACGQKVLQKNFEAHVNQERVRLESLVETFAARTRSLSELCDEIRSIKESLKKPELEKWIDENADKKFSENLQELEGVNPQILRASCTEADLKKISELLPPLISVAKAASAKAPPEVQELTTDGQALETALLIFEARPIAEKIVKVRVLKNFIGKLEEGVRAEIGLQAKTIISAISADIQTMWKIIHPNEHIEDVRLQVSDNTEKAIDICLKFHGLDQESPRLTLSEGFRNSLGLCIFLAMAQREANYDRPIILDDVVVSVDRNHRGMIVEVLEKIFASRQLIIFTHDRDWFIELKQRLDGWSFKALMPYETPALGIRWSAKSYGFDDARKFLTSDPDAAGNTARKIMDIELALFAEKLRIGLPYLHREKNDHRVAHEFLTQIIADGKKCLQRKKAPNDPKSEYEIDNEGLDALIEADKLLVAWGNKASHTFDVVKSEATKLIDACEKALGILSCQACTKVIHRLDDPKSQVLQCGCGAIRWRYGKN